MFEQCVIIAGNQTRRAGELLRALNLPADLVVTSGEWGVAKPQPEFFHRGREVAQAVPSATRYAGDHPANDGFPGKAAGLRRWGARQPLRPDALRLSAA